MILGLSVWRWAAFVALHVALAACFGVALAIILALRTIDDVPLWALFCLGFLFCAFFDRCERLWSYIINTAIEKEKRP